jgi:hypothetical protein
MAIFCRGTARIRHIDSGSEYEINSQELDWNSVDGCERGMGVETQFEATVNHPELGELTWSIWEYPEGVVNYRETNAGRHQIINDFEYAFES